uniref:Uncharacterized protein n=1 Tax=Echeneis naucrates TaxID=173247 RepID=A0A665UL41_ECHNA
MSFYSENPVSSNTDTARSAAVQPRCVLHPHKQMQKCKSMRKCTCMQPQKNVMLQIYLNAIIIHPPSCRCVHSNIHRDGANPSSQYSEALPS